MRSGHLAGRRQSGSGPNLPDFKLARACLSSPHGQFRYRLRPLSSFGTWMMSGKMTPEIRYALFETLVGPCGIAWGEAGLVAVQLPEGDPATTEQRLRDKGVHGAEAPSGEIADCIAGLQAYFEGETVDFGGLLLDWRRVSRSDRAIYELLREVPFGTMVTYGDLANRAGMPGGAQAIGAAMSRNPWPIVVPCHRVVAASGRLGGFSAFGGAMLKRKLLAMEGASFAEEAPVLPGLFGNPRIGS